MLPWLWVVVPLLLRAPPLSWCGFALSLVRSVGEEDWGFYQSQILCCPEVASALSDIGYLVLYPFSPCKFINIRIHAKFSSYSLGKQSRMVSP